MKHAGTKERNKYVSSKAVPRNENSFITNPLKIESISRD